MIKVLYVIDTLEGYGAEKSLVEITSNFKNTIPVFVHIYQGDMLKAKLEVAGIKVYSLDIEKKYAFKTAVNKLKDIYEKEKPDIVHATLFRSEIIARKLKKHIPNMYLIGSFVSNSYSTERYRAKSFIDKLKLDYFYHLDKKWAKEVDCFISNSYNIKKVTGEALNIPLNKIRVIYRGRSSKEFSANNSTSINIFNFKSNGITLLNVSRLIPLKGQLDLLRALPVILKKHPKLKLFFAGHGSYRSYLEEEASKLKILGNVEFLGRIEHINDLLQQSDIFVYPSYSEGIPGALIEAMLAEKVIIASNIPENLECINDDSAVIFEKGNIYDLTEKIIKVIENLNYFKEKGKKARKTAIERFEITKVSKEYEDTYQEIIKSKFNKSLKILHLIQKPQNRGAETFTVQLAKHQERLGAEVRIISIFSGNVKLSWQKEILSLNANPKNRFLDYSAWFKLFKIIKGFKPDLIQANAGDTLKYAVFSKKIFNWNVPIIFRNASEVGKYLKSPVQLKLNDFFYKNVDGIISVSQASQKDIVKNFPFLNGKTKVIPVGLENIKEIKPALLKPIGKKHIIHIGGFTFEKNHKGLINIFQGLLGQGVEAHLHLLGDGPLRRDIEDLVVKKNLSAYITFYGFVNDPLSYIKAGDVLVLPSIIEGLPGVLLEAMYCETPVIAYNVGGISEIINENTGVLIPKNDEQSFMHSLYNIIIRKDEIKVGNAKDMVDKHYMNSKLVEDFNKVYNTVLVK